MLQALRDMGFRVSLWINSYISERSPLAAEAIERGFVLRHPDGEPYVADVWHGSQPPCLIVDFSEPRAVRWFQDLLRPLLHQGVAVFKTDFAEGVPADAVAGNGMTGADLHNAYSLLFNDAVADATREVAGHGLVWARSSFLGGQRHSAQWAGDSNCSYPAMASVLRGGLSHGLSGIPFWSHDAGGFHGRPEPDLYVRWAQFGALSPLVRFHGTTSRLPWDFPDEARDGAVEAIRLRYRLLPYLYSAAVRAARTGAPMMRALLVDAPDDPAAWSADLEYLLGPDLLVAPMTDPSGTRTVYLPAGDWVDWWTGAELSAPAHHRVSTPLDRIPLFVRRGAVIPVVEVGPTVGDGPFGPITLLCFGIGAGDGHSGTRGTTRVAITVHDVDGDSLITVDSDGERPRITVAGPARVVGAQSGVDGAALDPVITHTRVRP
jgi:alpha-D-xyloside xylohydrolase